MWFLHYLNRSLMFNFCFLLTRFLSFSRLFIAINKYEKFRLVSFLSLLSLSFLKFRLDCISQYIRPFEMKQSKRLDLQLCKDSPLLEFRRRFPSFSLIEMHDILFSYAFNFGKLWCQACHLVCELSNFNHRNKDMAWVYEQLSLVGVYVFFNY